MKKKTLKKKIKKLSKRLKMLEQAYEICDCGTDCGCHDGDGGDSEDTQKQNETEK